MWQLNGRPLPPPPHVKQAILRQLARRYRARILVETGTYYGDTLQALHRSFSKLYSIELSVELYRQAVLRFADYPKIWLWNGDSGEVIADVLECVDKPAIFWLDGHYSGGMTALGTEVTPVFRELKLISGHPLRAWHLVVIDDARLFDGTDGYPTIEALSTEAKRLGFVHIDIKDDMVLLAAG